MQFVDVQWDMPISADGVVASYEWQLDNSGSWTNTGKPIISSDGTNNTYSYHLGIRDISIADGPHQVVVRAVNATGVNTAPAFSFSVGTPVVPPPPPPAPPLPPQNVRIVGNN